MNSCNVDAGTFGLTTNVAGTEMCIRDRAYLASKRRIQFSQWGIYRYFKELDA